MPNYFDGILNDSIITHARNMIAEVIRAWNVPCQIIYGITRYDDCPNCVYDPIGGKSSNRYTAGGPMPFSFGNCPMCAGLGKIPNEETDTINLAPIYDYKSWYPTINSNIESPYGFVQTMSLWDTRDVLIRAKEVIINTDVNSTTRARFERYGEPEPCGFGANDFIITMWKRIENG